MPEDLTLRMLKWAKEEADKAYSWHKNKGLLHNHVIPEAELEAFRIGFRDGFMKSLGVLTFQGYIKEKK